MNALRPLLDRIARAYDDFANTLMEIGGLDRPAAILTTHFMVKHKIAKVDSGIGRISVVHGAFLAEGPIRRAAEAAAKDTRLIKRLAEVANA